MQQQIMRGTVTSLDPFRVRIDGLDEDGQPCQRTAPATLNQVGGVDVSGRQRRWVGAYGADLPDPVDLGPLTTRVGNLEATVNTGSNRNSLLRSDLNALTARVSTLEEKVTALENRTWAASQSVALAAGAAFANVADFSVTFPAGQFASAPQIQAQVRGSFRAADYAVVNTSTTSTAAQMSVYALRSVTAVTLPVSLIATLT